MLGRLPPLTVIPGSGGNGMATLDIVSIASDIAGAGTALAGLILVYLGAVAVRYETLDSKDQALARDGLPSACAASLPRHSNCTRRSYSCSDSKALKSEPYATMIAAVAGVCASHVIFHSGNGSVLDTNEPRVTHL